MHIAQLNVGRPKYALDDPRFADFMDNLDRINAVAERSPGFIWRMTGDGDNNMDVTRSDDPGMNYNLSVWATADDLEHYVWNTVHAKFYNRKAEWFPKMDEAHFVMWPVEEGHLPNLDEALDRLAMLRQQGSTGAAFGWDGLPHLKRWIEKRCG